jgi:hypothetical protein
MKTRIITYKNYEERVLLGEHFNTVDLFKIIWNDPDYIKFQIVDEAETLVLSTHYAETGKSVAYLKVVHVKREEEILGKTYNAYNTPQFTYKTKVSWTVDGGTFKNRKEAHKNADRINLNASLLIEKYVEPTSTSNNKY